MCVYFIDQSTSFKKYIITRQIWKKLILWFGQLRKTWIKINNSWCYVSKRIKGVHYVLFSFFDKNNVWHMAIFFFLPILSHITWRDIRHFYTFLMFPLSFCQLFFGLILEKKSVNTSLYLSSPCSKLPKIEFRDFWQLLAW